MAGDSDTTSTRRPYVKPFLRNLEASNTEGKMYYVSEGNAFNPSYGPS